MKQGIQNTDYRLQTNNDLANQSVSPQDGLSAKRSVSGTVCQRSGLTIGLTGGIGSGKSTIANELARRGYTVYDCDREAKRIIAENEEVQKAIVDLLGEEAFIKVQSDKVQGTKYNTEYVAKRVFEDSHLLAALDAIIHPAVKEDIIAKHPDFVESAILYEAGIDALCDKVIVVDAPEDIRIARTIARDYHGDASPANIDKVRARIHAQAPIQPSAISIQPSAFTITNDGQRSISELVDKITQWMWKN